MSDKQIQAAYDLAKQRYADLGVDTEAALKTLATVPISLHCWQGDDVGGFEADGPEIGGGLAATGNYPGKARTADELRHDAAKALSLIPGKHRFNLHAFYGDFGGRRVARDAIRAEHFAGGSIGRRRSGSGWTSTRRSSRIRWPDDFTLAHPDPATR